MSRSSRIAVVTIALFLPVVSRADQWVSYTDGRVGGCWINRSGMIYGCTPQPPPPWHPTERSADDAQIHRLEQQNQQMRSQLQAQQDARAAALEQEKRLRQAVELQQRQAAEARQDAIQAQRNQYIQEDSRQNYQSYIKSMEGCPAFYAELARTQHIKRLGDVCVRTDKHGKIGTAENCPPCPK